MKPRQPGWNKKNVVQVLQKSLEKQEPTFNTCQEPLPCEIWSCRSCAGSGTRWLGTLASPQILGAPSGLIIALRFPTAHKGERVYLYGNVCGLYAYGCVCLHIRARLIQNGGHPHPSLATHANGYIAWRCARFRPQHLVSTDGVPCRQFGIVCASGYH